MRRSRNSHSQGCELDRSTHYGAHFSDRGHSFQADRGQRFSVIADGREVHEWLRASYLSCPASA
jgi:hypothetical protein